MLQVIPKKYYKRCELENGVKVTSYKDYYQIGSPLPHIQFDQGGFQFQVCGREELKKIQKLITFALKVVPKKEMPMEVLLNSLNK